MPRMLALENKLNHDERVCYAVESMPEKDVEVSNASLPVKIPFSVARLLCDTVTSDGPRSRAEPGAATSPAATPPDSSHRLYWRT